jgi:hypothetical protein
MTSLNETNSLAQIDEPRKSWAIEVVQTSHCGLCERPYPSLNPTAIWVCPQCCEIYNYDHTLATRALD